jgi:hypothetical protein
MLKVERWTFGKAMDYLSALKMQREQLDGMKRVNRPMREQIDETIAHVDEAISATGVEVTASNARLKALEAECFGSGRE